MANRIKNGEKRFEFKNGNEGSVDCKKISWFYWTINVGLIQRFFFSVYWKIKIILKIFVYYLLTN